MSEIEDHFKTFQLLLRMIGTSALTASDLPSWAFSSISRGKPRTTLVKDSVNNDFEGGFPEAADDDEK